MADSGRITPPPSLKHLFTENTGLLSPPNSLRSDSDTSELQPPQTEALKAHEPDQPGEQRVRGTVEKFIKDLLEFVAGGGQDTCHLQDLYYKPGPEFDPCLLQDGDMIYSLLPSFTTMIPDEVDFDKDEETGCLFCRFDFGYRESLGTSPQPDYFLPLGCLVEKSTKTGEIRSTNYILCLNVTEEPISLWLVYDYPASEEDGEGDDASTQIPFGGIYSTRDYDPDFHMPDQFDKPFKADHINKTPAFPRGLFLSLGHFDVAKVSEDICRDWIGHAVEGLDPYKVDDCMRRTLKICGGTLRAVETWPKTSAKEVSN